MDLLCPKIGFDKNSKSYYCVNKGLGSLCSVLTFLKCDIYKIVADEEHARRYINEREE